MFEGKNREILMKKLETQIRLGTQHKNMSLDEMLLLRRSINTGSAIIDSVYNISFEKLVLALYIKTNDENFLQFIKKYEYQIEEAKLNSENFLNKLHFFYMKTATQILEEGPRDFFEFLDFIIRLSRETKYENIFNGYVSLLMQQCCYFGFLLNKKEVICCGLTDDNELLFVDDPFPYSDCASYEVLVPMYKAIKNDKRLDFDILKKSYKKWSYDIDKIEDIQALDSCGRSFANNNNVMMPYINEDTIQMLPKKHLSGTDKDFPRMWMPTDIYEEKLNHRKYVLPSNGILARYKNAGSIKSILFQEIYKNDRMILLYKVVVRNNEECSGYYDLLTKDFYSIFENSNFNELHEKMKNFILENYYILTCDNDIHRKRNFMIKQVENIDEQEKDYPYQVLVNYSYKKNKSINNNKKAFYHYNRDKYISERKSINGFIRKLPKGQSASDEAKEFAIKLGYSLNENETFVKPFQKNVLKIKI